MSNMAVFHDFACDWYTRRAAALGIKEVGNTPNYVYFCEHLVPSWMPPPINVFKANLVAPFYSFTSIDVKEFQDELRQEALRRKNCLVAGVLEGVQQLAAVDVRAAVLLLEHRHSGWYRLYLRLTGERFPSSTHLLGQQLLTSPDKSMLLSEPQFGRFVMLCLDPPRGSEE